MPPFRARDRWGNSIRPKMSGRAWPAVCAGCATLRHKWPAVGGRWRMHRRFRDKLGLQPLPPSIELPSTMHRVSVNVGDHVEEHAGARVQRKRDLGIDRSDGASISAVADTAKVLLDSRPLARRSPQRHRTTWKKATDGLNRINATSLIGRNHRCIGSASDDIGKIIEVIGRSGGAKPTCWR